MPNTLVIANCEVVKPRVAAAEHISQVNYGFVDVNVIFFVQGFKNRPAAVVFAAMLKVFVVSVTVISAAFVCAISRTMTKL